MIKNILLTCVILFAGIGLKAQTCVPDTNLKVSGFLPANLPAAQEGVFYNEGISVLTFRDTYRMVGSLKIPVKLDSIRVTGISGLPAGVNYKCQHPRCVYLWDTVRCVSIYGTPAVAGNYPIKIYIRAFGKLSGATSITQNDSISRFTMVVNGQTAGVSTFSAGDYRLYPVPASSEVRIDGPGAAEHNWQVLDLSGRVLQVPVAVADGSVRLQITGLISGTYLVSGGGRVLRFVKQER